MVIKSKYESVCRRCRRTVQVGTQVEWNPGERGVTHVTCPSNPNDELEMDRQSAWVVEPVEPCVSKGTYTAVFGDEDDYATIRIKIAGPQSAFSGRAMICMHVDGRMSAFGFLDGDKVTVWKRFRTPELMPKVERAMDALEVVKRDPIAAGEAYALLSSNCWRCDKQLTVPASIHRGLGPECAKKVAA